MYIYRITLGEYEYQINQLYSHENKYTEKEFKDRVIGAMNYLKNRNEDYTDEWKVRDVLQEIYGFKPYKIPFEADLFCSWSIDQLYDK
jgi:hypothetical protein